MIRRFGESYRSDKVYKVRSGVYAILPLENNLLVTHQGLSSPEVQLPGGGIDPGEQPFHALYREILEETGWIISKPIKLGIYRRFTYMPEYNLWAEKICHIYKAKPVIKKHEPLELEHTAIWMSPTVARKLLTNDGDITFVRDCFNI